MTDAPDPTPTTETTETTGAPRPAGTPDPSGETIEVEVNGARRPVARGTTVADLVASVADSPRGLAVARNADVVPRSAWPATTLQPDDRIELLTAAQGG